jgi:hypothetical protein
MAKHHMHACGVKSQDAQNDHGVRGWQPFGSLDVVIAGTGHGSAFGGPKTREHCRHSFLGLLTPLNDAGIMNFRISCGTWNRFVAPDVVPNSQRSYAGSSFSLSQLRINSKRLGRKELLVIGFPMLSICS